MITNNVFEKDSEKFYSSFMNEPENHEWSETRLRVRYAETDQAGVVYHSNYLIWFEVGRVELCRDHGFNYRDMETEADAFLPVTEAHVKYRNPAKYDDEIIVRTRVIELRSRAIGFAYEVLRADDGALLAEGETRHIVMNSEGRAKAFPEKYAELMKKTKKNR
jgi:acyl-CoA thioester hydrolase